MTVSSDYNIVHKELYKTYGSASDWDCVACGEQAREWSWTHGEDPTSVRSYQARCAKCHKKYDGPQIGEKHSQARLTEQDVMDIRRKYAEGVLQWKIALEYGLATTYVGKIVRRERWAHVA